MIEPLGHIDQIPDSPGLVSSGEQAVVPVSPQTANIFGSAATRSEWEEWAKNNQAAFDSYNQFVEEHGMLSDHVPGWWNGYLGSI